MRTAVVILNWNTVGYLRRFIPGILASLGKDDTLFVADSGSTDGSLEVLASDFPEVVRIGLGENFGFAGGYNLAYEKMKRMGYAPEYFLLLNSDIEVSENWLEPLCTWMDGHPQCAACGPKLHALDIVNGEYVRTDRFEYAGAAGGHLDLLGYPFCNGRKLKKVEMDNGQYDSESSVFWATGAALMVRSKVWEALGGLDGEFFAHMEEIDFCWRAAIHGYHINIVPSSLVWHIGGGTLAPESPLKLKLNFRNSIWMLRRNLPSTLGPLRADLRLVLRLALDWASALVYLVSGRPEYAAAVSKAHSEARKRRIVREKGPGKPRLSRTFILLSR